MHLTCMGAAERQDTDVLAGANRRRSCDAMDGMYFASLAVQIQRSRPSLAGGGGGAINADKTVAFAKYIGKFVILR